MSKDYDTNVTCDSCCLAWTMTKDCGSGLWCPYCGHKQPMLSEDALCIKKAIETELRMDKSTSGREEDFQYYWGQIDFARTRNYISMEESELLHRLKNKFH